ncbi:MAG TPA: VWA domain-containing protein [Gemmatimonadales bacterium]|nr:VWA domain-containing protein [Gemmatimonadales bacterium]
MSVGLARPWLLLALLALPLWWWWRSRRASAPAVVSDAAPFRAASSRAWLLRVPPACRSLAFTSLILAAAGPFRSGDQMRVSADGIAIVLALDVSSSMLAEDFAPNNRLAVAKEQARAFIRGRRADRIGLVTFAGEAITLVPVTLDYPTLDRAVDAIQVGTPALEDGTAIGSGLATSVARLRKVPGKSKVILLLTDGENNRGLIDPRTAAQTAEAFGIKVYTVGVGSDGEARIPTGRGLNGFRYEMLPVRIDEALLTEIAEQTGGQYFRAKDAQALGRIFQQIDRLERTEVEVVRYARRDERTTPFLVLGLGFLLLEVLLSGTVVVRVP